MARTNRRTLKRKANKFFPRRSKKAKVVIPRAPRQGVTNFNHPFPTEKFVKLVYADNVQPVTTSMGTGNIMHYSFRSNSIYDPDHTSTIVGHQPLFYDQYAEIYHKYLVKACSIQVRPVSTNSNVEVGILFTGNSFDSTTMDPVQMMEQNNSRVNVIGNNANITNLSIYRNIMGMDGASIGEEDQYESVFGANPNFNRFIHVVARRTDQANLSDMKFIVKITYYCKLFKPKYFTTS